MRNSFSKETATKLVALFVAGAIAVFGEWNDQKEAKKISDMERRIAKLENKKES
jgi:hypothetical protein